MDASVHQHFESMSDNEILSTLSFFQVEYQPEPLKVLKEVAVARGVTEAAIREHRESCYPELALEFKCSQRGCELVLDRETFINGAYTCPACGVTNLLDYTDLGLPKGDGEAFAQMAVAAAGSMAGGIFLAIRDVKKRTKRREGIIDGTYWKALQKIARSRTDHSGG